MNINKYKAIDYSDNEPHTATVAEHIASIAQELRDFFASNNSVYDYMTCANYIEEAGATLNALSDKNTGDIVTISFADWSGYIIKDEEE